MSTAWHSLIQQVRPITLRITTPEGSGTGFLLWKGAAGSLCAVATAAHVVDRQHYWEQPIRLHQADTNKSLLLRHDQRAILLDEESDEAVIIFNNSDLVFTAAPALLPADQHLKPGVETGWLGFPAVAINELSFFSGKVSAFLRKKSRYLIDGVAINGVSGGPAFWDDKGTAKLVGVVSAYIPNRATGEVLPGVAVVVDLTEVHKMVKSLHSLDEAKKKEAPPPDVPPPSVDDKKPSPSPSPT